MTAHEKITKHGDWQIADHCTVAAATYRQALAYLVSCRMRYGMSWGYTKPRLVAFSSSSMLAILGVRE